ncbi:MAG: ABC transporter ATP-binding protein [Eubacteriales bacterium]|jgi:ATP-binding cassette subfamily B multidrug efflux pump|nr:ABC transporter ATP-binding protein [Eubacteriales bacterium]
MGKEPGKSVKTKDIVIKIFISRLYFFIPGIILLAVEAVLNTYIPLLTGQIIDMFTLKSDSLDNIKHHMFLLIATAVAAFVIRFVWRYFLMGNGRRYEKLLREAVFGHLVKLDSIFFDQNRTGDIITRVISDVSAIRMSLSFGITSLFEIGLALIMPLYIMVSEMSLPLALTAFAAIPPILLFLILIRKQIAINFTKIQEANAELSNKVDENINGIREIKSYGREDYESGEFRRLSENRYKAEVNQVKVSALLGPVSRIGFALTLGIFIIIGGMLVFNGKLSVGMFITFNTYIGTMTAPMVRISRNVQIWQRGIASMKRLDLIFCNEPSINDAKADMTLTDIEPDIVVENLNFSYTGDETVLHNINIKVKSGGTLGVMGKTGSGKSALLDVLSRRYSCEDGCVFIGGHDINRIPLDVLKKAEGCVTQDGFIFSDTVFENIAFFSGATDDEIIQAARTADLADDIEDFPDKYNAQVGERGVTLSGGQRQRISIARAVVKKPKILLLDDCMSAVDTGTEKRILDNIRNEYTGITKIITTHRISTVADADEIIFLENGHITERGTHGELLNKRGHYYNLFKMQSEHGEESYDFW